MSPNYLKRAARATFPPKPHLTSMLHGGKMDASGSDGCRMHSLDAPSSSLHRARRFAARDNASPGKWRAWWIGTFIHSLVRPPRVPSAWCRAEEEREMPRPDVMTTALGCRTYERRPTTTTMPVVTDWRWEGRHTVSFVLPFSFVNAAAVGAVARSAYGKWRVRVVSHINLQPLPSITWLEEILRASKSVGVTQEKHCWDYLVLRV